MPTERGRRPPIRRLTYPATVSPESINLPDQTLSPLGEGAMARVYRAEHPRFGQIAIKVLRHASEDAWRRLQREASAQARLNHPNILRIFGFGSFEGQPAILMQRIDGRPLDVVAAELPLEARIDLLLTVCDAVEHAHAAGLIHRDLKPGNVLVEERDGRLHPFVLDFGLVHDTAACSLTGAGELLGTPAYMSPEQARGDARHVDRRSDVFSLGAILFDLLTGRPPFQGRSVSDVLGQILGNDAPLAHRVSRSVPLALSRICAQCLERDPARRYPSAAALRQDLQHWLRGESLRARSIGLRYRAARWLRRNRVAGWSLGVACLIVLLAAGWSLHARRIAAEREEQVARLAEGGESLRQRMRLLRLAPAQDLSAAVSGLNEEMRALEQQATRLGEAGAKRTQRALAQAWLDLEHPEKAIAALQSWLAHTPHDAAALRLLAEAQLAHYRDISAALSDLSSEEIAEVLGAEGRALREGARDALQRASRIDPAASPRAHAELALLERDFDAALRAADDYRPGDLADYAGLALRATILAAQARVIDSSGDQQQAAAISRDALQHFEQARQVGRSDGRLLEAACRAAARDVRIQGRNGVKPPTAPGAFQPACDEAIHVRPDRAGSWSARALAWSAIAAVRATGKDASGERRALESMHDDAVQASRRAGARPEPTLLLARAQIRIAQLRQSGFAASLAGYDQAIATLTGLLAQHPRYVPALHELGIAYRQRGRLRANFKQSPGEDYELAVGALDTARQLQPDAVALADDLSLTYVFAFYDQRTRDAKAARALGERAVAVLDELLARQPDHPDILATQIANLADLWAFLRSLAPGAAPTSDAPLRERAHRLAEHLRQIAPQRLDGYTSSAMLEITAAESAHDRQLSEATALERAGTLLAQARSVGLAVPDGIDAWFATERLRETLLSADAQAEAALHAASAALAPALANDADVDAQMLAQLTELQLAVAELQWRQRAGRPVAAVIARGLARYQRLRDSDRDVGTAHCNGGELFLSRARLASGRARQRDAEQASVAFRACIDISPLSHAFRRPDLDAAQALLASGASH